MDCQRRSSARCSSAIPHVTRRQRTGPTSHTGPSTTCSNRNTSQECSQCDELVGRDGSQFKCPHCGYVRHADLNAAENISQREGDPCTA
ncbi:zinc ribbon domain-containing protein [Natronoarchaeum sp. GCM10025703]|uniref:zinc ribbon domain-containing protein n=1 Tax=unclassified Natronoarchaeum TaxID=2620183 RepID=UPI00360A7AA0